MTTVQETRVEAYRADVQAQAIVSCAARACASRFRGARVFGSAGRHRRRRLGMARSLANALAEVARDDPTAQPFFHRFRDRLPNARTASRSVAQLFLQQRGGGVEACPNSPGVTGYERRHRAPRSSPGGDFMGTYGALSVTWNEHHRAPFAPLCPTSIRAGQRPRGAAGGGQREDAAIIWSRFRAKAESGRSSGVRSAVNEVCARTGTPDCRRSAVRLGRRGSVLFLQARMKPRSGRGRQSPRGGCSDGAALSKKTSRGWRSAITEHVWRESSGVPRRNCVSRRDPGACWTGRRSARTWRRSFARWRRSMRRLSRFEEPASVGLELNRMYLRTEAAIRQGVLVNRTAEKVSVLPPLTITEAELDRALGRSMPLQRGSRRVTN